MLDSCKMLCLLLYLHTYKEEQIKCVGLNDLGAFREVILLLNHGSCSFVADKPHRLRETSEMGETEDAGYG